MVWVDYVRPGFELSKMIYEGVRDNPKAECVIMAKHGLATWGADSKSCYENTLRIIGEAEEAIRRKRFTLWKPEPVHAVDEYDFLPRLRGAVSAENKHVAAVDRSARVRAMADSPCAAELLQNRGSLPRPPGACEADTALCRSSTKSGGGGGPI